MLCPFCMEIQEPAPSIFGEGEPCSTPHCFKPSCCSECTECYDWFRAIEPEEGEVVHPKAARPSTREGQVPGIEGTAPGPVIPDGTIPSPFFRWADRIQPADCTEYPAYLIPDDVSAEVKAWYEKRNEKWKGRSKFDCNDKNVPHQGHLAEIAFLRYLIDNKVPYKMEVQEDVMDLLDFYWNDRTCDMKSSLLRGGKVDIPPKYYAANVTEKQEKMRKTQAYLFARFNERTRIMFLTGWISLEKWDKVKIFRKVGVPITPKYTPIESHYECKIFDLTSVEVLDEKPLREEKKEDTLPAAAPPKPAQEDIPW